MRLMYEPGVCIVSGSKSINGAVSSMKSVRPSMANTGVSSFKMFQSPCDEFMRDSASAARCLIPARWTTANSSSTNHKRQSGSRPVYLERLRIYRREEWSVRIVKRTLYKYGLSNRIAQTKARHSRSVAEYFISGKDSFSDQYPTGSAFTSGCFCSST